MEASTARFRFIGGGGGRICDATVGGGGAGRFGARAPPDMDTGAKRLKLRLWEREREVLRNWKKRRERGSEMERERERGESARGLKREWKMGSVG